MKKYYILFVCTGNTCRSPMAELMLKQMLKNSGVQTVTVKSAGLAVNEGDVINPNSRLILKNLGYKVGTFNSTQLTEKLIKKANAVICMGLGHKNSLSAYNNVYTLDELTSSGEVPDPYGLGIKEYLRSAEQIEKACQVLTKKIIYDGGVI